jgi:hypothetical protein
MDVIAYEVIILLMGQIENGLTYLIKLIGYRTGCNKSRNAAYAE